MTRAEGLEMGRYLGDTQGNQESTQQDTKNTPHCALHTSMDVALKNAVA